MAVKLRASQPGKMLREPAPGPVRPGVKYLTGGSSHLSEQSQLAFQVCIQDGAPHIVLPQAAGQPRNPARRFTGLGNGGVDEKDVGDDRSPYLLFDKAQIVCTFRANVIFFGGYLHVRNHTQSGRDDDRVFQGTRREGSREDIPQ
jgi:hypothetical protein